MTVHDVVAYILKQHGRTTAVRLHYFLYYSQAWSLVWDHRALFRAPIIADWGPKVPAVYARHRDQWEIRKWPWGSWRKVDAKARKTIDSVLKFYGRPNWTNHQVLADLVHAERPWRDARHGLHPGECGTAVIPRAALAEYYGSLEKVNNAK